LLSKRAFARSGHDRSVSIHETREQPGQLGDEVWLARLRLADAATELGALLSQLGEYREAESLLRHAISTYESRRGPNGAGLAAALNALSATCAARGRLGEAERLCRRVLQIINANT
jgi:tetratricopeptide (TPR) repeat protein